MLPVGIGFNGELRASFFSFLSAFNFHSASFANITVYSPWRLQRSFNQRCASAVVPLTVLWHQSFSTCIPYTVAPAMALSCDSSATPRLSVYSLPCGSMKCTVKVNVSVSLSLGAGLLAVCTTAYRPLPVCLDLHCAPAETVGVKQQVAGLCLDVLPVAGTRGRCKHKNAFESESS